MSTIAYRAGTIVGDTAISGGGTLLGVSDKIAATADGRAIGGAVGYASFISAFTRWIRTGRPGDAPCPKGPESHGFWIEAETPSVIRVVDDQGEHEIEAEFYAAGSGADLAVGAMAMGATALQAVDVAARFDARTRRPLLMFMFDEEPAEAGLMAPRSVENLTTAIDHASRLISGRPDAVICAALVVATKGDGNEVHVVAGRFGDSDLREQFVVEHLLDALPDDGDEDDELEAAPGAPLAN